MPNPGTRVRGTWQFLKTKEIERKEKVGGNLTKKGKYEMERANGEKSSILCTVSSNPSIVRVQTKARLARGHVQ
jgi:hypothetical protein